MSTALPPNVPTTIETELRSIDPQIQVQHIQDVADLQTHIKISSSNTATARALHHAVQHIQNKLREFAIVWKVDIPATIETSVTEGPVDQDRILPIAVRNVTILNHMIQDSRRAGFVAELSLTESATARHRKLTLTICPSTVQQLRNPLEGGMTEVRRALSLLDPTPEIGIQKGLLTLAGFDTTPQVQQTQPPHQQQGPREP